MIRFLPIVLACMIGISSCNASASTRNGDSSEQCTNEKIFDAVLSQVKDKSGLSTGELALEIAKCFQGTPYVAGTLEKEPEELRVYLDSTDCILFVEMCCSFALTVKSGKPSYQMLCDTIRGMRYRDGEVDGYASRIHYTSEWLQQNAKRGICTEITDSFGGVPLPQDFSFMSRHPDSYFQLKDNPDNVRKIAEMEGRLNRLSYSFIPQEAISRADIHDGDIICFVSKVPGLDIAHVALACTVDGEMHFIHASSRAGKVITESRSLQEYAENGIRVARLI